MRALNCVIYYVSLSSVPDTMLSAWLEKVVEAASLRA